LNIIDVIKQLFADPRIQNFYFKWEKVINEKGERIFNELHTGDRWKEIQVFSSLSISFLFLLFIFLNNE